MRRADEYDLFYLVGCCLWSVAQGLLEDDPVLAPARTGGVSHAGPGMARDGMWVTLGQTDQSGDNSAGRVGCDDEKSHEFTLTLSMPACSEGSMFLSADCGDCGPDECVVAEDGCVELDHQLGDGCDPETGQYVGSGEPVTVSQETAYVWRARTLLTAELAYGAACCLAGSPCVGFRCKTVEVVGVDQETSGGVVTMTFTVEFVW